jgi:hypothetical protein
MKISISGESVSEETAAPFYRLVGLLIAVGVPTLFWTSAFAIVSNALDATFAGSAMTGFAASVAVWTLVGSSFVMGGAHNQVMVTTKMPQ